MRPFGSPQKVNHSPEFLRDQLALVCDAFHHFLGFGVVYANRHGASIDRDV
jgi:hypothetical protein